LHTEYATKEGCVFALVDLNDVVGHSKREKKNPLRGLSPYYTLNVFEDVNEFAVTTNVNTCQTVVLVATSYDYTHNARVNGGV
jgi:hypothetical protein